MAKKVVATLELRVGEDKPYGFDLTDFCSNYWSPGERYGAAEVVRPRTVEDGGRGATGLEYVVSVAGQCKATEPVWPTSAGGTVTNGAATFTAQAISNSSLAKTISSSTWLSTDTSVVTVDNDTTETSNGEQKTQAFLTAVAAGTAEVINTITFSDGHVEKLAFKVKVVANG